MVSNKSTQASSFGPDMEPGLPLNSPGLSFWHRTTRGFKYLTANSTTAVPSSSEHVVIGSGISGALTAYSLIESGVDAKSIVILEAREAVSGASGRNAGHVRPDAFRGFSRYAQIHGPHQARKIIENEKIVLERVADFVKRHDVPCDFHHTSTFDVCLNPEFAAYEAEAFEAYRNAGGDVSHVSVLEGEDSKKKTRIQDAVASYEWPAGSIHPAKLAQWLLTSAIEKGARLWTFCPATSITPSSTSRWDIHTPRGTIAAKTIVHCTNAYSALLLPQLAGFLTPNKAQVHSLVPNRAYSGENILQSTYSLRYSIQHFYSLIQRQGDGMILLGVSRENPYLSNETKKGVISLDDSGFNQEVANDAMKKFNVMFPKSAEVGYQSRGEGLEGCWTGIVGMTKDSVPCVGQIDGAEGQWICAGFNAHGMARIFTCAPGVVKLIRGGIWADTGLPECFGYSRDRVAIASAQSPSPKARI